MMIGKYTVLACMALAFSAGLDAVPAKAETTDCVEIASLPTIITTQGVYCLKGKLSTNITSGNAIEIQAGNVVIDFNGFKLGNMAAGDGTEAIGVYALERKNIVLRNGSIRGFYYGAQLVGSGGSGHLVEDMRFDGNKYRGLRIDGANAVVRNNFFIDIGGSTANLGVETIGIDWGSGVVVTNNIISGVNAPSGPAYGIYMGTVDGGEISNNRIFGLTGSQMRGINVTSASTNVAVVGNRVLNSTTGNWGILNGATGGDCIDNHVRGYTTTLTSCDFSSGNITP
jgi:hypothetical protein